LQRKLPSPGFQVEVVMIDYDGTLPARSEVDSACKGSDVTSSGHVAATDGGVAGHSNRSDIAENDDVFSDSEGEETGVSKSRQAQAASGIGLAHPDHASNTTTEQMRNLTQGAEQLSLRSHEPSQINASKEPTAGGAGNPAPGTEIRHLDSGGASDIKAIAADASVFTFGDEDYESE
jgi:phosphatidylinositol-3,4,5-trisphosphate 3-phosphatase/dual-specificity protein phosphatase PTEN